VELLGPFTAVKNLYLTHEVARRVCGVLQELSGERVTEVLPALRRLFVDGPRSFEHVREVMRPFVAARELSGNPVAIDHWQRKTVSRIDDIRCTLSSNRIYSNLLSS